MDELITKILVKRFSTGFAVKYWRVTTTSILIIFEFVISLLALRCLRHHYKMLVYEARHLGTNYWLKDSSLAFTDSLWSQSLGTQSRCLRLKNLKINFTLNINFVKTVISSLQSSQKLIYPLYILITYRQIS